jgi:very-short-patch-repair endonuclease
MSALISKYYRYRSRYWQLQRLLFPSPAEVRFIELMGGRCTKIVHVKNHKTKFPLVIVWSLGKTLKRQNYKREVRYGRYYVDFANDLNRIIEVDGAAYHMDVIADMDREIDIKGRQPDARFLRVKAYQLYNNSAEVQRKVLTFID